MAKKKKKRLLKIKKTPIVLLLLLVIIIGVILHFNSKTYLFYKAFNKSINLTLISIKDILRTYSVISIKSFLNKSFKVSILYFFLTIESFALK